MLAEFAKLSFFAGIRSWRQSARYPIDPDALYLFADTNFFHEHRPPHEDYWKDVIDSPNIVLVLTTPILREIDGQKNAKNIRIQKSARALNSTINKITGDKNLYHEYRSSKPRVRLVLRPDLLPDQKFAGCLDYKSSNATDHRLVGTVSTFKRRHPAVASQLLTGDTGPKTAADMVGVPCVPIPDSWRRPIGTSDEERENRRLNSEIARLRAQEPVIEVSPILANDNVENGYILERRTYLPLTDDEIDAQIERITRCYPLITDFGPKPATGSRLHMFADVLRNMRGAWVPPSDESIGSYRDELYPQWLDEIRTILGSLHESLTGREVSMLAGVAFTNVGTRPAVSAEIRIGAKGPLWLSVNSANESGSDPALALPTPPPAPKGHWEIDNLGAGIRSAQAAIAGLDKFPEPLLASGIYDRGFPGVANTTRDPHSFYWGSQIAIRVGTRVTASCAEWRHAEEPEEFWIKIEAATAEYPVAGAMVVEVHAGNLSDPIRETYPVTINALEESCLLEAERLTKALIDA